jgi:hypothetical protein
MEALILFLQYRYKHSSSTGNGVPVCTVDLLLTHRNAVAGSYIGTGAVIQSQLIDVIKIVD